MIIAFLVGLTFNQFCGTRTQAAALFMPLKISHCKLEFEDAPESFFGIRTHRLHRDLEQFAGFFRGTNYVLSEHSVDYLPEIASCPVFF